MSLLDRFKQSLTARRRGERDAPADLGSARARETGGTPDTGGVGTQDQNSSTGTTENEQFVGRAGGDETGDVGESGAEARGDDQTGRGAGAARDD